MPIVIVFKLEDTAEVQKLRLSDTPTLEEVEAKIKSFFRVTDFILKDSQGVGIGNDNDLDVALSLDSTEISITEISKGALGVGDDSTQDGHGALHNTTEEALTRLATEVVSLRKELLAKDQANRLQLHEIAEKLPTVVVGFVVNASDATNEPAKAIALLNALCLRDQATLLEKSPYSLPLNVKWDPLSFTFSAGQEETDSYPFVLEYIQKCKIDRHAYDVGYGTRLSEGLLFNVPVYTLRTHADQHGGVILMNRLQGRTDLVVLNEGERPLGPGEHILRFMVDVCIEIKTPDVFAKSSSHCEKEAMLQLVGMNVNNAYSTPAVLLSNLARTHIVYFLVLAEHHNCRYEIVKRYCTSFAAALYLAIQPRDHISKDFSRPNTPPDEDELPVTQVHLVGMEAQMNDMHSGMEAVQIDEGPSP
eukprot:TRINITY_DN896_c0_g1_i6.p1 TRINITY_DN896_c0_g1~~TRINITY_DN896_c0_g1_i6.p1  ORF type:complete len:419 (+),score=57.20 TRINITY_DN896_c0_g1_i6:83-1339(+)